MDKYTRQEFAECFALRGYGSKKTALAWLGDRQEAHEADFEQCYRDTQKHQIRPIHYGVGADGQNLSDPQHMGNSRGQAASHIIRREIAINEAWERGWRKHQENLKAREKE